MSEHDSVSLRIPWYARGELPAEEHLEVERHLEGCEVCRNLLVQARMQIAFAEELAAPRAMKHVEPALLTMYAEDASRLDDDVREWIELTLRECATCREAYERLLEVHRSLARESAEPSRLAKRDESIWHLWWRQLAATVLQPAPALAYLVLLLLVIPVAVLKIGGGRPPGDIASPVQVLRTSSETVIRDGVETRPSVPPLFLPAAGPVLVILETAFEPDDLDRLAFTVELQQGDRTSWSRPVDREEFVVRGRRVELPLVLRTSRMKPGGDYRLLIQVSSPGDPLEGQALFSRGLRIRP